LVNIGKFDTKYSNQICAENFTLRKKIQWDQTFCEKIRPILSKYVSPKSSAYLGEFRAIFFRKKMLPTPKNIAQLAKYRPI
jgi:hypothetical protein